MSNTITTTQVIAATTGTAIGSVTGIVHGTASIGGNISKRVYNSIKDVEYKETTSLFVKSIKNAHVESKQRIYAEYQASGLDEDINI